MSWMGSLVYEANAKVLEKLKDITYLSPKTTWFHSAAVQFPCARHHSKWRRSWVGVKSSARNGHRDPKYPSPRQRPMVREDTGGPREGATCAWLPGYEAVGCTQAFLTM
ncbi:uncharacterized protein TNCV_4935371 [Trichonephila clavipes]|nr:uncharacterized protein TNCV_4935371 [Trichonephila clavipes]